MFCHNCSKLAILNTNRICIRCQGSILDNLSCICDKCSQEQNICSICLKKLHLNQNTNQFVYRKGCQSCGKH